jgi:Protein of unknown function (DUF3105)
VAKTPKNEKQGRQAVVDKMMAKQKSSERARGVRIVGVCVVLALLIVGAAAYRPVKDWWDQRAFDDLGLEDIGGPASACEKVETEDATGNQDHVEPGTALDILASPPAFGQHYNVWEPIDRKFYSASDRPELGNLIHNLEHGYTILWYDETAAEDSAMMTEIRGLADKFDSNDDNFRNKFKAAPWMSDDGDAFPDGQHIAFTHWSAGGVGDDATGKQVGAWQYCSEPSGAALKTFMDDYPYTDSPEPDAI